MNSPTHYIVYGSDDAMQGNDPANCYTCHSASQALAVAYKLHVDPATHIYCNVGEKHTIFFHTLDTLCCDVLRNHTACYFVDLDDYSGNPVPCSPHVITRAQLLSLILSHADEFDMMSYTYDPKSGLGRYTLGNVAKAYVVREMPNQTE